MIIYSYNNMELQQQKYDNFQIPLPNPNSNRYPFCIVWTILPCITWLLPWIGHTGICDQNGIIYDFMGYHINKQDMAFGNPKKYVKLKIDQKEKQRYISSLRQANSQFSNQAHDLCCNNCHHHVAHVLNLFGYRNRRNWTQLSVWWMCLWEGKYVAWWAPLLVYAPFLVILGCILLAVFIKH